MELRHLPYYFFIILFSCVEPTLVPDKDCSGVIGGDAVVDVCGVCGGPGKTGCDSTCGSTLQVDCFGDCFGNCEAAGCGTATRDCNGDCVSQGQKYYHEEYNCEYSDSLGIFLDLSTRTLTCFAVADSGNCNPKEPSCNFVNCNVDAMYENTVINCHGALPGCTSGGVCASSIDSLENELCNLWSIENINCEEFEFDGGDCDLIDCNDLHFSNFSCFEAWGVECVGDGSALGDGACDDGNDDVLPVNFNCEKWGFDGASCSTGWTGELGTDSYSCDGEISGSDCSD